MLLKRSPSAAILTRAACSWKSSAIAGRALSDLAALYSLCSDLSAFPREAARPGTRGVALRERFRLLGAARATSPPSQSRPPRFSAAMAECAKGWQMGQEAASQKRHLLQDEGNRGEAPHRSPRRSPPSAPILCPGERSKRLTNVDMRGYRAAGAGASRAEVAAASWPDTRLHSFRCSAAAKRDGDARRARIVRCSLRVLLGSSLSHSFRRQLTPSHGRL
jgi:hypothetical protein